mgnify:CR=1 FL=1
MKIDLKKLNASAHASIPFDETIDLTDESSMARSRFKALSTSKAWFPMKAVL